MAWQVERTGLAVEELIREGTPVRLGPCCFVVPASLLVSQPEVFVCPKANQFALVPSPVHLPESSRSNVVFRPEQPADTESFRGRCRPPRERPHPEPKDSKTA